MSIARSTGQAFAKCADGNDFQRNRAALETAGVEFIVENGGGAGVSLALKEK